MKNNYGSTKNIIESIQEQDQNELTKFVYIGTVAETGDRMPPIHWGPECERKSWNYGARAKVDPFFAQVWDPLHEPDEMREYPKLV